MASRRPPLRLEELGARVLPSITPLTVPLPPAAPALASAPSVAVHALEDHEHGDHSDSHALAGRGHGNYSSEAGPADAGATYQLSGHANLAGLGRVKVTGSVHAVGFIRKGHAGGTLTFTNAKGSVTVDIRGPEQDGFSPLPGHFSYRIVSGTGAYARLSDSGTLALSLHAHGKFTLSIPASPDA